MIDRLLKVWRHLVIAKRMKRENGFYFNKCTGVYGVYVCEGMPILRVSLSVCVCACVCVCVCARVVCVCGVCVCVCIAKLISTYLYISFSHRCYIIYTW